MSSVFGFVWDCFVCANMPVSVLRATTRVKEERKGESTIGDREGDHDERHDPIDQEKEQSERLIY